MTKFAFHAVLAALAVAPIAAQAGEQPARAPALAQRDVQAAIDAQYAAIKAALESRNAAPIAFLLAPHFSVTSQDGGPLPASVLLAGMAQFSAIPDLHITFEPNSIATTDAGVVVRQHYTIEIPEVDAKGTRHEADIDASSTDTWANYGDRWVLESIHFTHWTGRYDGEAVQDLCFGCYPSER